MTFAEILLELQVLTQQRSQQPQEAAGAFTESVNSSVLSTLGYDPETQTMTATFNNGSRYEYHNVSAYIAQAWISSGSKGHYLNAVVKRIPQITYTKVG